MNRFRQLNVLFLARFFKVHQPAVIFELPPLPTRLVKEFSLAKKSLGAASLQDFSYWSFEGSLYSLEWE